MRRIMNRDTLCEVLYAPGVGAVALDLAVAYLLRYLAGWYQARYGVELTLPVSEAVAIQFLVDHIQRKGKNGLVSELPVEIDQELVSAGLKAKNAWTIHASFGQTWRTNNEVEGVTAPYFALAFPVAGAGAVRLQAADMRVEHSKTQQAGATADSTPDKPIAGRIAEALAAWLAAANTTQGPLFRRLWKDRVGPALLPGSIATIVKRRAAMAGLEGDLARKA